MKLWESFLSTLVVGGTVFTLATAYILLISWLEKFFK